MKLKIPTHYSTAGCPRMTTNREIVRFDVSFQQHFNSLFFCAIKSYKLKIPRSPPSCQSWMVFVPRRRRLKRCILATSIVCVVVYLLLTFSRLWSFDLYEKNTETKKGNEGDPIVIGNRSSRTIISAFLSETIVTPFNFCFLVVSKRK